MDQSPWNPCDITHHPKEPGWEALRQSFIKDGHVITAPKSLNSEWLRLSTYADYPREASCSALLLARQGFVFIGLGQSNEITIVCVFCLTLVTNLDNNYDSESIENLHSSCSAVSAKALENEVIKVGDTDAFYTFFSEFGHLNGNHEQSSLSSEDLYGSSSEASNLPTESGDAHRQYSTSPSVSEASDTQEEHNTLASAVADSTSDSQQQSSADQVCQNLPRPDAGFLNTSSSSSPGPEGHPTNHREPRHPSADNTSRTYASNNNALRVGSHQVESPSESSEFVTNRAQSLSLPWERGVGSDTTNHDRDASRNPISFTSGHNASDAVITADGATSSTLSQDSASRSASQPQIEHSSPTSPQTSSISSSNSQQNQNDNQTSSQDGTLSYEKLGIMTARPKRLEFAVLAVRLESFQGWPQGHHIQPLPLVQAGFFFTGYSDCARCFFCGGGLRNWEEGDDVWVEHARWFPKCVFVRQNLGQAFIAVVQDLNKEQEMIPYSDVIAEMNIRGLGNEIPQGIKDDKSELGRDTAIKILMEEGFIKSDVIEAAEYLKKGGQSLSAELVYDELVKRAKRRSCADRKSKESKSIVARRKSKNQKKHQETLESLRDVIGELRQQSQCKMCMDKEVAMIFLPCGHFVSCIDCSYALKNCPICRQSIKGVVRGQLE